VFACACACVFHQVFVDYTPAQVRLQLAKAAAGEAAAAGAGVTAQRAAAAAAGTCPLTALLPGDSSSSRRQQQQRARKRTPGSSSNSWQQQQQQQHHGDETYNQDDLNAAGLCALSRRIAAAFPSASTAVIQLEVGDYADHAAPGAPVAQRDCIVVLPPNNCYKQHQ